MPGSISLDVDDGYLGLPAKVKAIYAWALARGYDYVCKVDDDVYLRPDRLLACGFEQHDYSGRLSGRPIGVPYASGFTYWLSRRAAELVACSTVQDWAEDRMVGHTLHAAGVPLHQDSRYVVLRDPKCTGPRSWNDVISGGQVEAAQVLSEHQQYMHSAQQAER